MYQGENWKLLDYSESMIYLMKLVDDYNEKKFEYTIFDIETTSLSPWEGEIIAYSFYNKMDAKAVCIPLMVNNEVKPEWPNPVENINFNIDIGQKARLMNECTKVIETIPIVGHNLKFDLKFCRVHMALDLTKVRVMDDTLIMAFMKWNKLKPLALKYLCREQFEIPEDWEKELWAYLDLYNLNKDKHFGNVPTGILGKYASLDSYYNEMLYDFLKRYRIAGTENVTKTVTSMIVPFTEVETNGLHCDDEMVEFVHNSLVRSNTILSRELLEFPEINKLIEYRLPELLLANSKKRKPKSEEEVRKEAINLKSTKDLRELFFNPSLFALPRNDVKVSEKTGDFSVDKETLNKFQLDPSVSKNAKDFLEKLLLHKANSKLITTYTSKIKEEAIDGTFKPEFNIIGTATGRLSSGFHTWPKKSDVKRMFDSRWKDRGGLILSADFSQLELRVLCSIANEPIMIRAFEENKDLHSMTASLIFKKDFKDISKQERDAAKKINFGIAYGMSPLSLQEDLKCTKDEALKIFNGFFTSYPKIYDWVKKQQIDVFKNKGVWTQSGRFIPIQEAFSSPDYVGQKNEDIGSAQRKAINNPIQGSASDVVGDSYLATYDYLKKHDLKTLFIGTVHDSVQYDVFPGELFDIVNQVKKNSERLTMLKNPWIRCPLKVDIGLGVSWGGCLDFKITEISQDKLVGKVEGLSKDIKQFYHVASLIYNTRYEVIKEEIIDESKFQHNNFIKDLYHWEADFCIKKS